MALPRRFLPSTALLAAFEATARTGGVTAAAEELDLTQSAVSRQIRALEAQLGAPLFERDRGRLRPTPAAEAYLTGPSLASRPCLSLRKLPTSRPLSCSCRAPAQPSTVTNAARTTSLAELLV